MSLFLMNVISSHSNMVPAVLMLQRWRSIPPAFFPLLVVLQMGMVNEFVSLWCVVHQTGNMLNSNIYIFLEYVMIVWQFQRWNRWAPFFIIALGSIGIAVWITDNLIMHAMTEDNSLFRVFYSGIIVGLSVLQIFKMTAGHPITLNKNPILRFCCGFVLYYIFKAYYECFNLMHAGLSDTFFFRLWLVLNIINLLANLIYSSAIVCIKQKMPFTLSY